MKTHNYDETNITRMRETQDKKINSKITENTTKLTNKHMYFKEDGSFGLLSRKRDFVC